MVEGKTEVQSDVLNRSVDILIPSCENDVQLIGCINSIMEQSVKRYNVTVINNGNEGSTERLVKTFSTGPAVNVIDAGGNRGWEGGLKLGLEKTKAPYVCFLNDDTLITPGNGDWMEKMLQSFGDKDVAAVGPISNFVMGYQNMTVFLPPKRFVVTRLIGFCMVVRRKALEEVGGVITDLPGGDDFDLSLRFNKAGKKMIIDGRVFVYHFGCQTGARVRSDWNSNEMIRETRNEMIRRHGLLAYIEMSNTPPAPYEP